ncbi:streptogrisin D [Streptomyces sp. Amel2xB2]|uniref:S1 family peptidase n=1 Tax=Streptomyces sp. Amel2xB2 TaxID=1305829 RepID=UPI000DBF56D3|nr:S1 family peptidase [Streptomyces sp. Amel2xB2]RAJ68963.1 streptogrisin D [Streptomyces sp. Amel2xB2]
MSHRRKDSKRAYVIAGAGTAALALAAITLPYASAGQQDESGPRTMSAKAAAAMGTKLADENGANTAGWFIDGKAKKLVMNVLDEETAQRVEQSGAEARIVQNSKAELKKVSDTLAGAGAVPGTAWSVDPRTNKVSVLADQTVDNQGWNSLTKTAAGMDGKMSLQRSSGKFQRLHGNGGMGAQGNGQGNGQGIGDQGMGNGQGDQGNGQGNGNGQGAGNGDGAGDDGSGAGGDAAADGVLGGDAIFADGTRCSLGFNVTVDGAPGFLTAGHCGNAAKNWTSDEAGANAFGTIQDSQFPETDFAIATLDDAQAEATSAVNLDPLGSGQGGTQEITGAAEAAVGMQVQRSGSTTGVTDGEVTGLDATVNYGGGDIVNGLIQTNVCAEPGDSGGSMFSEDKAVGLTSGGSGDCTQGGETFFQPVTDALEATGAEIGSGGGDAGQQQGQEQGQEQEQGLFQ